MMPGKHQRTTWLFKVIMAATGCLAIMAGVALAISLAQPQMSLAANANMGHAIDAPDNTNTPTVTRTPVPPCGVTYYTGMGMPLIIPDGGSVTSIITVETNIHISYIEVANMFFEHERPEDIDVFLTSPWGHHYTLFTDICRRDPWTYTNTGHTLVDHSANRVGSSCPPFRESFRSDGSLAARGEYAQGVWTLEIVDDAANGYGGLLGDWGLRIASMACPSPTSPPSYTPTNTPTSTSTPTDTPTATDTPMPNDTSTPAPTVEAILVGHVNWQGRPAQPNTLQQLPISLTLKSGASEVNYTNLSTDANGFFSATVTGLLDSTYDWRAKSPKYLARAGTLTFSDQRPNLLTTYLDIGLMLAGDCNNDNVVTIADFNILKPTFGRSIGYPNYDDRADFTGDRMVTILDFNLLKINFGTTGAPPINPR